MRLQWMHIAGIITGLAIFGANAVSEIAVNEVLSNEPGGSNLFEWIELHNNSTVDKDWSWYTLEVDGQFVQLPIGGALGPDSYIVICRSQPEFLSIPMWNTGAVSWTNENLYEPPSMPTLSNPGGNIKLSHDLLGLVSEFTWDATGGDGISWERVYPDSMYVEQSVDTLGSTPGLKNSLTPMDFDMALDTVEVTLNEGVTHLRFVLVNRGLNTYDSGTITLVEENSIGPDDTLDVIDIPSTPPGFTTLVNELYEFSGLYVPLKATLSDDDRPRNNSLSFTAVGKDYPAVLLWEVLSNPDPSTSIGSEWVELFNRSDILVDLDGYGLGDHGLVNTIVDGPYIVLPGEYLILCEDSAAFASYYPSFDGRFHQPSSWPGFRNSNDTVRLIDHLGFESDRFVYVSSFSDNYTWQRDRIDGDEQWGRSENTGGTPGLANKTVFQPGAPRTKINITPEYLSPDGDGFQDEVAITIEAVEASGYSMKLFDRQGRQVHTFFENTSHIRREYLFDGTTNSGVRLPIGIYILYFEAIGVEQFKMTLVVSR